MTYKLGWSDEDRSYVATCDEFPSLSYLSEDISDAFLGIVRLAHETRRDIANTCTCGAVPGDEHTVECRCYESPLTQAEIRRLRHLLEGEAS